MKKPIYTYQAKVENKGKIYTRIIESESLMAATNDAKVYGKVIAIKKVFALRGWLEPKFEDADRQIFLQRLAAMIGSNVGQSEALTLMETTFTGKIRTVSSRLLRQVTTGKTLDTAFDAMTSKDFPSATIALIKAGLHSGDTAASLRNAAEFEIEMGRIKKESGSGMLSALMGFVSAVGLTFGTTRIMAPQIMESQLMKMAKDKINVKWAEDLGTFCEIALGTTALLFLLLWFNDKFLRHAFPLFVDKIALKIPFYKDLVTAKNSYVALYGLSMLTRNNVRLKDAMVLASEVAQKGRLRHDLLNAAKAIENGRSNEWAKELTMLHPTDIAALCTSEDIKNITNALDNISIQYKNIYAARVRLLSPILQMISVIFLCLSGAVLFGLTMVPMFQFAAVATSGM